MLTRLRVLRAFLYTVGLCSFALGTRAQEPENAHAERCGRTSCRELGQLLTAAVSAAQDQFETSRNRLRPHQVYYEGRFSRIAGFVERLLRLRNKEVTGPTLDCPNCPPPPDSETVYDVQKIERLGAATKKKVINGLKKKPDLAPLKDYAQNEFPGLPATTSIRGRRYVKEGIGDSWSDGVLAWLKDLLDSGPGPVTLHFTSTPEPGARIVVNIFQTDPKTNEWLTEGTTTEGSIHDQPRGEYRYRVTGDGFMAGTGWLNATGRKKKYNFLCRLSSKTESTCDRQEE